MTLGDRQKLDAAWRPAVLLLRLPELNPQLLQPFAQDRLG
jgi:hypothetical protein